MSKFKPNVIAISTIIATGTFASSLVNADENPFQMTDLSSGYMVADSHGKYCKKKMKKMDTNEDGSVSKDEFMAYMEKKFARKDKNGDGVLKGKNTAKVNAVKVNAAKRKPIAKFNTMQFVKGGHSPPFLMQEKIMLIAYRPIVSAWMHEHFK